MKQTLLAILFTLYLSCLGFAQQASVNDYKYVLVPDKYEFLDEPNKYRLNELTEFLFKKSGFTPIMQSSKNRPEDLQRNPCLALKADVVNIRSFLSTKLIVELHNCKDQLIYTSEEGFSKEKKYELAYNFALRDAFKSIRRLNYKYEPTENLTAMIAPKQSQPSEINQASTAKTGVFVATVSAQIPKTETTSVKINTTEGNVLYAQKIKTGFQLVNAEPKIVYKIKPTSLDEVFLVEGKEALIYKKDTVWVIEYYAEGSLTTEPLNIKF